MDPTLVNDASFSTANPSSYSLSEIWPFHGSRGGRGGGGRMAGDKDTGLRIGWPVEGNSSRNASIDESTVTEQSESRRKRRESASEDDSSKFGSSSSDNNLNDSKRMKATVTAYQNGNSKGEAEASSKADKMADEEAKFSELPKQEYIHVRARRGQATDNHSLAERARREKISERMKILQDLVPGCNKVIGKASVLDEIINYIQALQHQVEFLSMKLEAVNTRANPSTGEFQAKELRAQTFDAAGMVYGSDSLREYMQGPPSEWLHMQVGSSFERGP